MKELKNAKVTAPNSATFTCNVTGDPAPKIRWFKSDREVASGKKYSMSYQDGVATLVVSQTDLSDIGCYSCEADNRVGRVTSEANLDVHSKLNTVLNNFRVCKFSWISDFGPFHEVLNSRFFNLKNIYFLLSLGVTDCQYTV